MQTRCCCYCCCCLVARLCPTLCDPMDCSMPGSSVFHYFLEFAQIHVHWFSDAIQSSHLLSSLSPPALNLSQHWGLFQRVGSSHQVAKGLEFQLQHQSFCWVGRTGKRSPKWRWLKDKKGKARTNRTKEGPRTRVRTSGKTNNTPGWPNLHRTGPRRDKHINRGAKASSPPPPPCALGRSSRVFGWTCPHTSKMDFPAIF